ncbi:MAG: hypothetical protein IT318_12120 [Anaerolineales bacterium]|nr:hypothetical protein [Anaerolineales bacterium]
MISQFVGLLALMAFAGLIAGLTLLAQRKGARRRVLRRIDGYQSLPATVGTAVEAGQRLHFSLGTGTVGGADTAAMLAGVVVLDQVAAAAAMSDRPPIVTTADGTAMLLAQDTLRGVYARQNALARYDPESAQAVGLTPASFGAAQTMLPSDQAVAGALLLGSIGTEAVLLTEAGQRAGVTTLAGTDNLTAQAVLYAAADHPLIGEDLFAGGAYVGGAPAHLASLTAQDILRLAVGVAILLGVAAKTLGLF